MNYTTSEIAEVLRQYNDKMPEPGLPQMTISTLLTDSRSLRDANETLFFAIQTSNNDGHRYLQNLYDRGVRNFVVKHIPQSMQALTDCNFLVVSDTTKALQLIALHHRHKFNVPVIGITGSRGKTTVKEWLNQLLKDDFNIIRSPRSYNSQWGVPLSIWEMNNETQLAIFEAGISRPEEMIKLQSMISPDLCIITNIGEEHHEGFSTTLAKCEEKLILTRGCDCLIYNGDDALISKAVESSSLAVKEIAWSMRDNDRPLYISKVTRENDITKIDYTYLKMDGSFTLPLTSDMDIENAIHCLAAMLYLGCKHHDISERMSKLSPVGTRLDVIAGVNNSSLIYDSYTSDIHSLVHALDFMSNRVASSQSKVVILSDVMHDTKNVTDLYKKLARLLEQKQIDQFIGIGPEISQNSKYFGVNSLFYGNTEEFLADMSLSNFDNALILVKGASQFNFSRIKETLMARQHETVLEVNLDALVHNFNNFRAKIKPETGIVCMLKASGYGAGSYELAKTLQSQGAAYIAVAALDEGFDLRKAGITMPIMVLNPKGVNYRTLFLNKLEPEIYSFGMLSEIIREAEKYGISQYPVHIKLDTGMHRLGFQEKDIPKLIHILETQNAVEPYSVFSHLATADCLDMDNYTLRQFEIFERCCDLLKKRFGNLKRHILNSAGIARFPEHQYDMVRLGIGLYGIPVLPESMHGNLRPVSSLHSVIISINEWDEGTTIGYSRRGVLSRRSRIATIPIGYADGIDRHLGNGHTSMFVNGHRCPTVGNICMDACMIDVTDAECEIGDSVEIFGDNIPVTEIAEKLGTIPYEVLTSISTRVKRIYYRE